MIFPSLPIRLKSTIQFVGHVFRLSSFWARVHPKHISSTTTLRQRHDYSRDLDSPDREQSCLQSRARSKILTECGVARPAQPSWWRLCRSPRRRQGWNNRSRLCWMGEEAIQRSSQAEGEAIVERRSDLYHLNRDPSLNLLAGCGKTRLMPKIPKEFSLWRRCQNCLRMLKKARLLTRPTPARRDAPFRGQGRSERRSEAYASVR